MGEVNQELKDACKSLYDKHKGVLKIIMENLELGSPRAEAIGSFLSTNQELAEIHSTKSAWYFLTNALKEFLPEVLPRNWNGQRRPILFWFAIGEAQIRLGVDVGPWVDTDARNKLVRDLTEKINGTPRDARTDTYTQIWSRSIDTSEEPDAEEIAEKMNSLYEQMKGVEVIASVTEVVKKTWPPKT